jgi:hypothetical protein
MSHHEADLIDVMVVLSEELQITLDEAVIQLKLQGLEVCDIDPINGVIEGTIESGKIAAISLLPCAKYVRKVFEYTADYPIGDPRNTDSDEEEDLPEPR